MSFIGAVLAVSLLRGVGFVGTLAGAQNPLAVVIPYLALAAACGLGMWGIARGVIIEPPAFVTNAVNALVEGMARRSAAWTGQVR
jgi:lipopolysaccharide export system permease protein